MDTYRPTKHDKFNLHTNPLLVAGQWIYTILKFSIFGAILISFGISSRCYRGVIAICKTVQICDQH